MCISFCFLFFLFSNSSILEFKFFSGFLQVYRVVLFPVSFTEFSIPLFEFLFNNFFSSIILISFKILLYAKNHVLHEIISITSHHNEISTVIHTIDEETKG